MNNSSNKIHRNPQRNKVDVVPKYVPNYKLLGVPLQDFEVPRRNAYPVQQQKIEKVTMPIPVVGNNREHVWSGVDNEVIGNNLDVDPNHQMIDNNEFVTDADIGYVPTIETIGHAPTRIKSPFVEIAVEEKEDVVLQNSFSSLKEDEYIIIINDDIVCRGDISYIQDEVRKFVFGEQTYMGNTIVIEDIVVLKNIKIKVGVFIE